jgi:hypothetical protein
MSRHDIGAWYRRNYPAAPAHNDRAVATLAALGPLYNLRRFGERRSDGGLRPIPGTHGGFMVHLWPGANLATFDWGEMTALTLAAHRHQCRVQLDVVGRHLRLMVHPRKVTGTRMMERHPTLGDLAARALHLDAGVGGERPVLTRVDEIDAVVYTVRIPRPAQQEAS